MGITKIVVCANIDYLILTKSFCQAVMTVYTDVMRAWG